MHQVTKLSLTPPTVLVSIQLLNDLENFFLNELPIILNIEKSLVTKKYLVVIEEPNTEYKFDTIKDYQYQLLPPKTIKVSQGVTINKWKLESENSYDIYVYFSRSKLYSEIRINITESASSAVTETIKQKLILILSHYKTTNSYFFVPTGIKSFVCTAFIVVLVLDFSHKYTNNQLFFIITIMVWLVLYQIKPYSHFDTQQNNLRDKIVNWLLLAPLSAVIGLAIKMLLGK